MNDVFTRFLFFYKIVLIFYIILVKEKLKKFPEVVMDDIIILNQGIKKTLAKNGTIFMSSISILGICYVNKRVHAYSPTNACKSTFVRLIIFKGLKKY